MPTVRPRPEAAKDFDGSIAFHEEKFKELLLYVATRCETNPRFGATKLNKVLFYADFLAFARWGSPITGARYQRLQWGPAPRQLPPMVQRLMRAGDAYIEPVGRQKRLVAMRPPSLSCFTQVELDLVNEVIERLWNHTAVEVSDLSHEMVGWRAFATKEDIPYPTVFVSAQAPTEDDIEWAQGIARERGLLAANPSPSSK